MKNASIADMKTLLEYSSDALLISDSKGKILYVTPSIERISGISVETHLNRNIRDLIREKYLNHSATLEALEKEEPVTCKVKTIAGMHQLNTALPVLDTSGKISRIVCNIRNYKLYQGQLRHREKDRTGTSTFTPYAPDYDYPYRLIQSGEYEIVVKSKKMNYTVEMTMRVGQVDSTVLIYGETGVGKELIARLVHSSSYRSKTGAFIKVNCASFNQSLIEAELFGYEPGAFTGALRSGKVGYFELADRGTLFLDEIAELSLEAQAKLLGVLQDRELFKVGGTKPKTVDIRIVAATNKNLEKMVKEGRFREDLFYRLNVVPIEVPPLRERRDDIPALIHYFNHKLQERYSLQKEMGMDLIEHLTRYSWPGNVRELYNLIERLFVTVPQKVITAAHLSGPYISALSEHFPPVKEKRGNLKEMVEEFEIAVVKRTLETCSTQEEAARMLGISLSSLTRRLRKINKDKKG